MPPHPRTHRATKRHKGAPTSHRLDNPTPRRARRTAILVALLLAVSVIPASAHYRIRAGDTLSEIARKHHTSVRALARINDIANPNRIFAGDLIRIHRGPHDHGRVRHRDRRGPGKTFRLTAFHRKTTGPIPCRGDWYRHPGYSWADWAGDVNIPGSSDYGNVVRATHSGVVVAANRWRDSYGLHVRVHGNPTSTLYAHLSDIDVHLGEHISRGEVIGNVGSSGNSTGPHLHYERY